MGARGILVAVNGQSFELDVEPRTSLLDALRELLGLTGTKKGCNQGGCGACTVLVDGRRVLSCLTLAVQTDGAAVTTIEGVDHPLQQAVVAFDGLQCGYCTPGQICSAIGMLAEFAADGTGAAGELTRAEIAERMSGNLCRCGAYNGIVDAIASVIGGTGAGA
jgi:xanthine dehydrogenase YagT iron-sulfur-binding subunit